MNIINTIYHDKIEWHAFNVTENLSFNNSSHNNNIHGCKNDGCAIRWKKRHYPNEIIPKSNRKES